MNKKFLFSLVLICLMQTSFAQHTWTVAANETKPWTRWWWMGSAVDEAGIKEQLTQLSAAGFGGVEIVPIYGAIGFENRYIKYLSPKWMKMLDYTVSEAKARNMGVYISVGTGWPIGGSDVAIADAATKLIIQKYSLKANERLTDKVVVGDPRQKKYASLSALMMFKKLGISVLGVVENMSGHICSSCGNLDFVFGHEGGKKMAENFGLTLLGQLPLDRTICELSDLGQPHEIVKPNSDIAILYRDIARKVSAQLSLQPKAYNPIIPSLVN